MEDNRKVFFVHFIEGISNFRQAKEVISKSKLFGRGDESSSINFIRFSDELDKDNRLEEYEPYENYGVYLDNLQLAIVELAEGYNIEDIKSIPEVGEVTPDQHKKVSTLNPTFGTSSDNWGYSYLGIQSATETGIGVKVAILDSGLDVNHPFFATKDIEGVNVDRRRPKNEIEDKYGHGTHMAGIIAGGEFESKRIGVAPKVELFVAKVLNNSGAALRKSDMAKGIEWAIKKDCQVINMSWGFTDLSPDRVFTRVSTLADQLGIFMVAAVGNDSDRNLGTYGPLNCPANHKEILAVTGINENGCLYNRANRAAIGQQIDFTAPGVDIFSSFPSNKDPSQRGYALWSGTSQATAYISGLLALMRERYPNESKSFIYQKVKGVNEEGRDPDTGFGLPGIFTLKHRSIMAKPSNDYRGTIILNKDMGLQEVYSSQNYGTFYSLYMTFDYAVDKADKNKVILSNIRFTLVNYKGVVNLGIVELEEKPDVDRDTGEKYQAFIVKVRAFERKRGMTLMDNQGVVKSVTINRKEISTIRITRTLLKMTAFDSLKGPNHPDNIAFDDEFYYRDGLVFDDDNARLPRGGMVSGGGGSSGKRCYEVSLKIV